MASDGEMERADVGGAGSESEGVFRCFHCDEVLVGTSDAQAHFGRTEASTPACRISGSERGLVGTIRALELERDSAVSARDRAEEEAESDWWSETAVLRAVRGAKSAHEVRCHIESITGRAIAAEAILVAAERLDSKLVEAARNEVCGPGTYFPISTGGPLVDINVLREALPALPEPSGEVMSKVAMYAAADEQEVGRAEKENRYKLTVRAVRQYAEAYGADVIEHVRAERRAAQHESAGVDGQALDRQMRTGSAGEQPDRERNEGGACVSGAA